MKQCRCIDRANKELKKEGGELVTTIQLSTGVQRALLPTQKIAGVRCRYKFIAANYCPFCGKLYPGVQTEKPKRSQ